MKGHKIKHIKQSGMYTYKIVKCASKEIEFFYIVMIYLVKLSIFLIRLELINKHFK